MLFQYIYFVSLIQVTNSIRINVFSEGVRSDNLFLHKSSRYLPFTDLPIEAFAKLAVILCNRVMRKIDSTQFKERKLQPIVVVHSCFSFTIFYY